MKSISKSLVINAVFVILFATGISRGDELADMATKANQLYAGGDIAGAETALKAALARFGDNAAARTLVLNNLGAIYDATGDFDRAESAYRQAIVSGRKVVEGSSPEMLTLVANLAAFYLSYGRHEKADRVFQELDQNAPRWRLTKTPATARLFDLAGGIATHAERYADAEELLLHARELFSALPGINEMDRAASLNNLATVYGFTQRLDKAMETAREAFEMARSNEERYPAEVSGILANLALIEGRTGRTDEAKQHFQQALAIADTKVRHANPTALMVYLDYATFLRETGRRREAKRMEQRAAGIAAEMTRGSSIHHTVDYESFRDHRSSR